MVHEFLEAVDSERVKAKKLDILRTHGEDSFKMTMIWNFDESVISMLPEGNVPYQPVESDVQANIEKVFHRELPFVILQDSSIVL